MLLDPTSYNNLNVNHNLNMSEKLVSANGMNILYFNSRSLRNKIIEVELLLSKYNETIHCFVITETWLDDTETDFYNFQNYNAYHSVRDKRGGGAAIYCHKTLNSSLISSEIILESSHCLIVKLLNFNIHIGAIYRCPDYKRREFTDIFSTYLNKQKNIIFFGDFNINMLRYDSNDVSYFKNTIDSDGFSLLNNLELSYATRICETSISTIDLIVTDLYQYEYDIGVDNLNFSDHKLLTLILHKNLPINISDEYYFKTDYDKVKSLLPVKLQSNQINSLSALKNTVTDIVNESTIKVKKKVDINRYKKEWCTPELLGLIRKRKVYYDLHKKYPTNQFYIDKYKQLQEGVSALAVSLKKGYFDNQFKDVSNNSRRTWAIINNLIYNKTLTRKNDLPSEIIVDNNMITDAYEVANYMNKYFANIGNILELEHNNICPINLHLDNTLLLSTFEPVTISEIGNLIKDLKPKAAAGYDMIGPSILKNNIKEFSRILTTLLNSVLEEGTFPDELKLAKVTLIHKGGSKSNPSNYRPISVLPIFSKILETVIKNRLILFLKKTNFIKSKQFGFQERSGTTSACLNLMECIYDKIDKKLKTCCMFIDVRKAFDSVNHVILIDKLRKIGIRDRALNMFESYLSNRRQTIQTENICSLEEYIKSGVPQGSILGPILFLIYVNDMFDCPLNGTLQMYADDAAIIYGEDNFQTMKEKITHDLRTLSNWMCVNCLSVNYQKTNYIIFTQKNLNTTGMFDYLLFDMFKINRVDGCKYLGLIINSSLNFVNHVDYIKSNVARFVGVLRRISEYVSFNTKLKLYYAYINSHIIYLNPLWSSAPKFKLDQLQTLQNKAVKQVYNLPYLTPTISLYGRGILPLNCISKYELCFMVYKLKNKLIKSDFNFIPNSSIHNHLTRFFNNLRASFKRINLTKNSIFSRGIDTFNEIPLQIKEEININIFKNKLRNHYCLKFNENPMV